MGRLKRARELWAYFREAFALLWTSSHPDSGRTVDEVMDELTALRARYGLKER